MQELILFQAKNSLTGAKMLDAWQVKKIQLAKYLTPSLDAMYLMSRVSYRDLIIFGEIRSTGGRASEEARFPNFLYMQLLNLHAEPSI